MLILAATADKLQVVTGQAVTVDVHASYVDYNGSTVTPAKQNTAISTAATTDVVAAPAASTQRNVKLLTARNKGSSAVDVTVQFNQNGTLYELQKVSLDAGATLQFIEGVGFQLVSPATPQSAFVALTGTYTLVSQTGAQKLFNATANGALTVKALTSYFFECFFTLSSMSATSGNMGFDLLGAGTATLTSAALFAHGLDATTQTTAAAIGGVFVASSGQAGNMVTAATGTAVHVFIRGIFRVNAGGTIIPSVSLTTAAAAIVGVNSYFRCQEIGSNTIAFSGDWS